MLLLKLFLYNLRFSTTFVDLAFMLFSVSPDM